LLLWGHERMTVTEQVESLSRAVAELRDEEQAAAREEIWRKLAAITRDLSHLTDHAMGLYEAASVLAPETAEMAVEIWDSLHRNFASVSTVLERIQKIYPGLVETQRETIRDLIQKSALAVLEWDAKAELDRCDTIAREGFAMLDAEEAKLEH
jgi:hypothetical protein